MSFLLGESHEMKNVFTKKKENNWTKIDRPNFFFSRRSKSVKYFFFLKWRALVYKQLDSHFYANHRITKLSIHFSTTCNSMSACYYWNCARWTISYTAIPVKDVNWYYQISPQTIHFELFFYNRKMSKFRLHIIYIGRTYFSFLMTFFQSDVSFYHGI